MVKPKLRAKSFDSKGPNEDSMIERRHQSELEKTLALAAEQLIPLQKLAVLDSVLDDDPVATLVWVTDASDTREHNAYTRADSGRGN